MVKETVVSNKSAAGLRHSAIAERIRLREEWSSLKGTDDEGEPPTKVKKKQTKVFSKNLHNIREMSEKPTKVMTNLSAWRQDKENAGPQSIQVTPCEALRGVVALVDVGEESRALPLRAALTALGATVVPAWSPLVSHLVWSQAGCRSTRARARSLACSVVSPLWVRACAAAARRVPERVFPSTKRDSDLPSPPTLCRLLKKAERENWPLLGLQSDDESAEGRPVRLRISSDTDNNTNDRTNDGDTTQESVDVESRVNTAPRRALPVSISPPPANPKSRRKLFTVRAEAEKSDVEDSPARGKKTRTEKTQNPEKAKTRPEKAKTRDNRVPERQKKQYKSGQEQKENLEKAKRLAKKLAAEPAVNRRIERTQRRRVSSVPRIVLTGMPRSQSQLVIAAVKALNGKLQNNVNHKTTHVLLGTCKEDDNNENNQNGEGKIQKNKITNRRIDNNLISICNECNATDSEYVGVPNCLHVGACDNDVITISSSDNQDSNDKNHNSDNNGDKKVNVDDNVKTSDNRRDRHDISDLCDGITNDRSKRTLKTLLGAARGCRVLHAQWALDSAKAKRWLPYAGYEVTYLLKIAQKARVERFALDKMHAEYAFDVFRGMRVVVSQTAHQRDAALQLLTLCGAEIVDADDAQDGGCTQNGGWTQNGGRTQYCATQYGATQNTAWTQYGRATHYGAFEDCDIVIRIGSVENEVSSKWVFDSVAAGRPRTARRYINRNVAVEE